MGDLLPLGATTLAAVTPPDPDEPHLLLWNTAAFYGLRAEQAPRRRRIDHHDEGGLVGSLVVGRDGARATNGMGAPFGGVDLVRPADTAARVAAVVDHALAVLADDGIEELEVRLQPLHHGGSAATAAFVLLNRGFAVAEAELSSYLDLSAIPDGASYASSLKPAARKMLRRSSGQGLVLGQVAVDDERRWAAAYAVLHDNRASRGRPMHLALDYVRAIRDAFAGAVRLLVAEHEGAVVAAALLYRVAPGRDVVQYWGDHGHDLPVSPMNALAAAVVDHALAAGTAHVDIGISTESGVPNDGLLQFKRSIGGRVEPRLVLRRGGLT